MTKLDYENLEYLLGKLHIELGAVFCLVPFAVHDSTHIATYTDKGEVDKKVMGMNIEDCVKKLKA